MLISRKRFGAGSILVAIALGLALVGLLGMNRSAGAQEATTVTIANFAFSPNSITVQAGTTVTWVNNDSAPHTATGDNGEFDTGQIAPGGSASITFDTAGNFTYHCTIHPNMTASITVQESSGDTGNTGNTSGQTGQLPNTGARAGDNAFGMAAYLAIGALVMAVGGLAIRRRSA